MPDYVSIDDAREMTGLRLVLTAFPGPPWSEAAKAVFQGKGIPYTPVAQVPIQTNAALLEWTGFQNAPIAVYDDEPARAGWTDLLFLAERLSPEPGLIPDDPYERALMFGLAHELCGQDGFAWNRRYRMIWDALDSKGRGGIDRDLAAYLIDRYGYSQDLALRAPRRIKDILELISAQFRRQRERGREHLIGERLSALDLYWATFMSLVRPFEGDLCPMPEGLRRSYTIEDPELLDAIDPGLFALRERIYRDYLVLPIDS